MLSLSAVVRRLMVPLHIATIPLSIWKKANKSSTSDGRCVVFIKISFCGLVGDGPEAAFVNNHHA